MDQLTEARVINKRRNCSVEQRNNSANNEKSLKNSENSLKIKNSISPITIRVCFGVEIRDLVRILQQQVNASQSKRG